MNKQSILEKVSVSLIALLLVSLLIPILSFAMSVHLQYNYTTGNLAGGVYTNDPNSVQVVTSTTNGGQTSVSTITYAVYGTKYDLGLYDNNNIHYYSVTFNVYAGRAPNKITVSDSTNLTPQLSAFVWSSGFTNTTYYDYTYQGSERLSEYRMAGNQNFSSYLGDSYLQPASTIVSFTPTQSLSNSFEVAFPKTQASSTNINFSSLSSKLMLWDNSNSTETVISNVYQPQEWDYTNNHYVLSNRNLIVKAQTQLTSGHSYSLKMSPSSSGNEIKLPAAGTYSASVFLGSFGSSTSQGLTFNYVNALNSLFLDNFTIPSTQSSSPNLGTTPTPTTTPVPTPTPTPSVKNSDKGVDITTDSVLGKSEDGHSTATVTLDTATFNKALNDLKDKAKDKQLITVNVEHSNADVSNVILSSDALAKAAVNNKDIVLSIVSDNVSYELPLKLLDLATLTKSLGTDASNAKVNISIEKMSGTVADKINNEAKATGLVTLGSPVDFTITIEANGIKKEVNNFGSTYVSRTIMIPQTITANQASAVLYDPATGQFSFVPAIFNTVDGKTTITIKRNGNSKYVIVSSDKSFADTVNMYATDDINLLASKLIVNGVTANEFKPYDKVTRAQFTALLVRALGLTVDTTPTTFSDINKTDWYADAVSTAVKASLIKGFENGTFRPNEPITREQMASLISKSLTITGKTVAVDDSQAVQILSKYSDQAAVSSWAATDTAKVTQAGIMQGNDGNFTPKAISDRAQAVITLKRLLQYLQFIN